MMGRRVRAVMVFLLLMCCSHPALAQAKAQNDIRGEVRLSVLSEPPVWVGQQVRIAVELMSNGLAFGFNERYGSRRFELPDVPGALVMQFDTSAVNLSERREGETWQILRYEFNVFPLTAGNIVIPPFPVGFTSRSDFGSAEVSFDLQTQALGFEVALPAGAQDGQPLVTTASFDLSVNWQPEPGELEVGDALRVEVRRTVADFPAMGLAPLSLPPMDGVSIYADEPEVNDRINRGSLVGERIERATLVFERAGDYQLPGVSLSYWDPAREAFREVSAEPLEITVAPGSLSAAPMNTGAASPAKRMSATFWLTLLLISALIAVSGWYLYRRWSLPERHQWRSLRAACRQGDAAKSARCLQSWLPLSGLDARSLADLARRYPQHAMQEALTGLQTALLAGPAGDWRGEPLLAALREAAQLPADSASITRLAPLNP